MKTFIKQWKYNKYLRKSTLTFAEYICLSSKEIPSNSIHIFNMTRHHKLNNPIFIKSHKHIPLPSTSIPKEIVNKQLVNFSNSLQWRIFFLNSPPNPKYNPKFKIIPKQNVRPFFFNQRTFSFEGSIAEDELILLRTALNPLLDLAPIIKSKRNNTISNLLKEFPDTTLCLTDKNLGFAALYTAHYEELVLAHLQNPETYQLCKNSIDSITSNTKSSLMKLKNHFKPYLNPAELQFINKQLPIESNFPCFKGMPKIHKKGKLNIRPIVTSFNWYTRPIALILNERIKNLTTEPLPFILKSSNELIPQLPKILNIDELLITIDIKSMYPSIDRTKLIEALEIYFPNDPLLPILLKFILNNSYCQFNDKPYLQIQGIPMGDNASVCLANLFCSVFLDQTIANCRYITQYYRYIDDIFIIWNGPREEIQPFIDFWDTLSSLTLELVDVSASKINYLDITIYKETYTNILHTSLFHKPISKFNYLSPSSCHPPHILSGWIYAEIQRHYRLNTNPTIRFIKLYDFKKKLLTRGYKYYFLDPIFDKAKKHYFTPDTNPTSKSKTNPILPFVLPYYPDERSQKIYKTIKYSLRRITNSILPGHRPILVHSVLPNISSIIKKRP